MTAIMYALGVNVVEFRQAAVRRRLPSPGQSRQRTDGHRVTQHGERRGRNAARQCFSGASVRASTEAEDTSVPSVEQELPRLSVDLDLVFPDHTLSRDRVKKK
jgi:hypothetical protein